MRQRLGGTRGQRSATIQDVSRLAGVSIGTVSHVMNGTARVSSEKEERVRDAIRRLNYHPFHAASSLVRGQTGTVALSYVSSRLEGDLFKCQILISLATAVSQSGLSLLLAPEDGAAGPGGSVVGRFARERRLDGVVLTDVDLEAGRLAELMEIGTACVVYGAVSVDGIDSVNVDERRAVQLAVDHLASLGHRAIAFLAAPTTEDYARDRLAAYVERMASAGVAPTVIPAAGYRVGDGTRAVARHRRLDEVTGLVCATDQLALGAMAALRARGRRVPDDVSVVGIDDIPMAVLAAPGLTTIRQPIDRIARALVGRLMPALSRDGEHGVVRARHTVVAPTLVVRASTAPPATVPQATGPTSAGPHGGRPRVRA